MASEERWPFDQIVDLREGLAEVRASGRHVEAEIGDLRQELRGEIADVRGDLRRLDARLFHLLLAQLATLATALGALVASLAA